MKPGIMLDVQKTILTGSKDGGTCPNNKDRQCRKIESPTNPGPSEVKEKLSDTA